MIALAGLMHITWAALVFFSSSETGPTTSAITFTDLIPDPYARASVYALAGILAFASFRASDRHRSLLVFPQQVLLCISAGSVLAAIISGQFADGSIYPRAFIARDQSVYILMAIVHAIELLPRRVALSYAPFLCRRR